jgi:hypothetical protein
MMSGPVRLNSSVRTTEHLVAYAVVWILTTPIPKKFRGVGWERVPIALE